MDTREKLIDAIEKEKPYIPTEDYEVGYNNGLTMAQSIILATDNNVGHKWIPVTERLPEQTSRCLVARMDFVTNTPFIDVLWFEKGVWWNRLHGGNYAVTHWMPLPQPPKGE